MKTYVLLGFDVERDIEPVSVKSLGIQKGLPKILDIMDDFNVNATFYLLGDTVKENIDLYKSIKFNHEIGSHSNNHINLNDKSNSELMNQIYRSTAVIKKYVGVRPTAFRAPYLYSNTKLINLLEKYKYKTDSSYYTPVYMNQLLPYYPDRKNWTKKGDSTILEFPIVSDPTVFNSNFSNIWSTWKIKNLKDTFQKINNLMKEQRKQTLNCVLTFYFHPWEFVKIKNLSEPKLTEGTGLNAIIRFKRLLKWLKNDKDAQFVTMGDFKNLLNYTL